MSAPPLARPAPRPAATPSGRVLRWGPVSLVVSPRLVTVTAVLLVLALVLGAFALTVGTLQIPAHTVLRIMTGRGEPGAMTHVVLNLRLPRVVTALFTGAALGVSGSVFQSVSRNALGSPDVIGFTTGAATGAIVQIVLFSASGAQIALGAVLGGLLTAAVVYVLSMKGGVTGGYRLILVGIGVGAVLSALNGLLLVMGDLDRAVEANLWLSGTLEARKWSHAVPVMLGTLLLIPCVAALARQASLIEMGDDLAGQLGVRVERVRVLCMTVAVLLAGLATGAAGPIAFVALAAAQIVVRLTGHRGLPVLSAAAMGACLLIGADVATQLLPWRATVPIGRVTGVIGGIYLIWLLTRSRQV